MLSAELQRGRVRGEEVNQELGEVLGELQNARLDSQESKRQQQRNEVLENLLRLYPDTLVRHPCLTATNTSLDQTGKI